ncbi:MAG: DUF882 domain-containing protein [Steroidobacteraceae bacterium]
MSSPRPAKRCCAAPGRRRLLAVMISAAAIGAWPARAAEGPGRRLVLMNTHTGERLDTVYRVEAGYLPAELGRLDWMLRDHRTGAVIPLDARLFDLLHELAQAAGVEPRYQVISGYRSPATNAMLAATTDGVSSRSLHMEGKAVDVRLEGVALAKLRELALARAAGGVGYYPASDFVHLDLGRVRSWSGQA